MLKDELEEMLVEDEQSSKDESVGMLSDEDLEEDCNQDDKEMWKQKIEDDAVVQETWEDIARDENDDSVEVKNEKENKDIVLKEEIDRVVLFNKYWKKCS